MVAAPAVTIVCATYDRPVLLEVMLTSVLVSAALVPNRVRVLVVDDCSTIEGAEDVAKRLSVDYMRLPENRGVAGALLAGFCEVDTEFYALWGDDDAFLPNWFELHLAKIAEGFDVVAGSYWRANAQLTPKRPMILPVATLDDLKQGKVTVNDGALVRTSSALPFRLERERAMMMTFWLAMLSARRKFAAIEEPTWLYRRHRGQLSESRPSEHDMALRREALAEYAEPLVPDWVENFG